MNVHLESTHPVTSGMAIFVFTYWLQAQTDWCFSLYTCMYIIHEHLLHLVVCKVITRALHFRTHLWYALQIARAETAESQLLFAESKLFLAETTAVRFYSLRIHACVAVCSNYLWLNIWWIYTKSCQTWAQQPVCAVAWVDCKGWQNAALNWDDKMYTVPAGPCTKQVEAVEQKRLLEQVVEKQAVELENATNQMTIYQVRNYYILLFVHFTISIRMSTCICTHWYVYI